MSAQGALLFARYAYPPNELGYCGPPGAGALLEPAALADIEHRARQFDGAWCYLEVIAEALEVADPLSAEVVEAYWVGSDRLAAVAPAALVARLEDRFRAQVGGTWRGAADRAVAHHSFQVFEVYPWATLLRAGRPPGPALNVLDQCRIRVGTVEGVTGEVVTVSSRPLVWDGSALHVGRPTANEARWSVAGRALIRRPAVGERIALHWDWVCDVLSEEQADRIEDLEKRQRGAAGLDPS